MNRHDTHRTSGFSIVELLITVVIIAAITAIVIPNLLDTLEKARQKRTLADMRNTGTAILAWMTDQMGAASAGRQVKVPDFSALSSDEITALLVPTYIDRVPEVDGWGHPYEYFMGRQAAQSVPGSTILIRSIGRDGRIQGDDYDWGTFDAADYDQDILWIDGLFARLPEYGGSRNQTRVLD